MSLRKFNALILKSHETGNTSEVVHTVSAEFGQLSVYARGLQSPKSSLRAILQPLSLVELTVFLRDGSEMGTLREATLIENNSALTSDLERFSLALMLAEATFESCEPAHEAADLFAALLHSLHDLDPRSDVPPLAAAARSFAELLSVSGFAPQIEADLLRPWPANQPRPRVFHLDIANATIHARHAQPPTAPHWPLRTERRLSEVPIPPSAVRFLYSIDRGETTPIPSEEAHQLLEALVRLCEHHIERGLKFWRRVSGE